MASLKQDSKWIVILKQLISKKPHSVSWKLYFITLYIAISIVLDGYFSRNFEIFMFELVQAALEELQLPSATPVSSYTVNNHRILCE